MLLDNIRVLDMSKVIAGPHGTMQLAAFGADVIKVEIPGSGDDTRAYVPDIGSKDTSPLLVACNAGKRSMTLDMKNPAAKDVFLDLVKTADVLVENMRTGVMEKLGIGYEDVKKVKPDIIYCSISGYGRTGPYAFKGGYDILAQAEFGLMGMTGGSNGEPCRTGYSLTDVGTGMNLVNSVLAALIHRERTGEGQWICLSLMQTEMYFSASMPTIYAIDGKIVKPNGTKSVMMSPYQAYHVKDGWVLIGSSNEKQWQRLAALPQFQPFSAKPQYKTMVDRVNNNDELTVDIENALKDMTPQEVMAMCEEIDIPVAPINTMKEIFADEYYAEATIDYVDQPGYGPVAITKPPYVFSNPNMLLEHREHAPLLGEHTDEVLKELGYDDAKIAKLREDKVI